MAQTYDAIIIGAGHNGLVAAGYLAKAGRKVLVLERREEVGGALANVELAPGFTAPAVYHTVGRLRKSVVDDLGLIRHGLQLIDPPVRVFAPQPEGGPLTLWSDVARTAEDLRARSAHDAAAYPVFDRQVRALASFLAYINAVTPPDIKDPSLADAMAGLKLGKAFKDLGRKASREVTRILPMAVADYVDEAFETDALRGAIASRAVQFTATGPWSAGSASVLLNDSAGNEGGAAGQSTFAKGGPGALADALASAASSVFFYTLTCTDLGHGNNLDWYSTDVVFESCDVLASGFEGGALERALRAVLDDVRLEAQHGACVDSARLGSAWRSAQLLVDGFFRGRRVLGFAIAS